MSSFDDDSSDSDEDVPLAMLGGKNLRSPDNGNDSGDDDGDENEFDDENDDESSYASEDESDDERGENGDTSSESDSDDDVPLSALKSVKSPTKKKKSTSSSSSSSSKKKKTPAKEKTVAKKKTPTKKKAPTPKKKAASNGMSKSKSASSGDLVTVSSELYSKSEKGRLINALLCRWWYAMTWPNPKTTPSSPPAGYDALDGFPGVFVCTSGDQVGAIHDTRDHATCPNFRNFARKDAEELRSLLITAIDKQKEILVEHEGEGTDTEKELDVLRKWAKKLNSSKADKEAEKVLKAAKLSIK
uniref:Uncharacterized protein n=1 Tax=Ditylum brightwellii TaxID=49249 RepID=A0A6U3Q806_9STRA|mmetsp:Transcript_19341/g.28865  ORF Transcript_19341/g.28865 Transcript_19341/m.28865 type:complete len:301 (+) Transcript_19341:125-1027(+)